MTDKAEIAELVRQKMAQGKPKGKGRVELRSNKRGPRIDESSNTRLFVRSNTIDNIAEVSQGRKGNVERINLKDHEVPSKSQIKRLAGRKMLPSNRVFASCGVGSSRSVVLGIIKAVAHEQTGCIVRSPDASKLPKISRSTTSRDTGNVIGGRQRIW
jgi:hypothetical protein